MRSISLKNLGIKEDVYSWCKHQANLHHQTRNKVRRVLKRTIPSFLDVFQPPTFIYDLCCVLNRMSVKIERKFSYSTPV